MISLVLGLLFFVGIHLGVAGTTLRDRLVAMMGEGRFRGVFSLASLLGIIWAVSAYNGAPYIETWGYLEWWKPFAIVLMIPAFVLAFVGITTPNPATAGSERLVAQPPRGMVRVTRHPFLIGVAIWAGVHLIGNGDLAALLFFGAFLVVTIGGTLSIDHKRRRLIGAAWDPFASATSIVPFAAIASGRNRFVPAEIKPWQWGVAVVGYVLFLGGHAHIVGVSPFPW